MALRRPELAPADLVAGPCGVGNVAMTVDAQELEGGVTDTHPARFPMADGSKTDAQEFGCVITAESRENPLITELPSLNQLDTRLFPETLAALSFKGFLYIMLPTGCTMRVALRDRGSETWSGSTARLLQPRRQQLLRQSLINRSPAYQSGHPAGDQHRCQDGQQQIAAVG